jgi:hypothetical protein
MGIIEPQLLSFRAEFSNSSMQVVMLVVKHLPNDDVVLALFRSVPKPTARYVFQNERKRTDINRSSKATLTLHTEARCFV